MLMKFLFAEKRLSRREVFAWLENYEQETQAYLTLLEIQRDPGKDDWPLHQGLVIEADFMKLTMQLEWIRLARRRLTEAEPPAGLYRARGSKTAIGWIILPDGSQVGIQTTGEESAPAPKLDPDNPEVTVDGEQLQGEPVSGDLDV